MALLNSFQQFFPIYPSLIRKKLEWPFLAILNLYQSFCKKLLEKIWNSHSWPFQFFSDNLSVHITLSECNSLKSNEICTFLDFTVKLKQIHIPFIQCNGLESNEKFLAEKIVRKNIFVKKIFEKFCPKLRNFLKFRNVPKFVF